AFSNHETLPASVPGSARLGLLALAQALAQAVDVVERHQVRVDPAEHALAQELLGGLLVELAQLLLVDHEQAVEVDHVAVLAVRRTLAQAHVAGFEQVVLAQLVHEPASARHVLLELAEEAHGTAQQLGIAAVLVEQAIALGAETLVTLVEEHGEVVAFLAGRLLGQHERVATHEGGNVDVRRPLAFGVDEKVLVLAQAQKSHRPASARSLPANTIGRSRAARPNSTPVSGTECAPSANFMFGIGLRRRSLWSLRLSGTGRS